LARIPQGSILVLISDDAAAAAAARKRNDGNGEGYSSCDTGRCTVVGQSGFIELSGDSQGERSCNSDADARGGRAQIRLPLLNPYKVLLLLLLLLLLPITGDASGLRQGERLRGVLERLLVGLLITLCSIASAAGDPVVGLNCSNESSCS
jgi:hypothetical protein